MASSKLSAIALIGVAFGVPQAGMAWGNEGHQVIALIAASELTPTAKSAVSNLLDVAETTDAMFTASTWADEIRPTRPETRPWHYVNIEIGSSGYDAARDCPKSDCVVAQVQREVAIVSDKTLAKPVRAEALRLLIHFVGDLHQPLHAADNNDRGGNEVRVILNGRERNLHAIWDTDVVEALGTDSRTVAVELERQTTPDNTRRWSRGSVADWTNQSFQIARTQIYGTLPGSGGTDAPIVLPVDYARRQVKITGLQLECAGVRLATLLNAVLGK